MKLVNHPDIKFKHYMLDHIEEIRRTSFFITVQSTKNIYFGARCIYICILTLYLTMYLYLHINLLCMLGLISNNLKIRIFQIIIISILYNQMYHDFNRQKFNRKQRMFHLRIRVARVSMFALLLKRKSWKYSNLKHK